jgi:uncharacterized NAD-dependent epimerase/dehydratase family protein
MFAYQYLILTQGALGPYTAKTASAAVRYIPERVAGIVDPVHAGRRVEEVLGFGGDIPIVGTLREGLALRPTAVLIGIAPSGGQLPAEWRPPILACIEAGLPIVSGLHVYLADDPEIAEAAAACDVQLHDLRRPPPDLNVSRGRARLVEPLVLHTVGRDCNIGKMTAALEIRRELEREGIRVGFAPTGQTGILIEGWGIAVDSVIADYINGAAEQLVLRAAGGNDIVLVEGQGALAHPAYSGVTLGLLHGSLPDAMIVCDQPTRRHPVGASGAYSWMVLPSLRETVQLYEAAIRPLRESRVIGAALNTSDLSEPEAREAIARAEDETGLPATDPVRFGSGPLIDVILAARKAKRERETSPSEGA